MRSTRVTVSLPEEVAREARAACERREMTLSDACARALVRYLGLECPMCGERHKEEETDSHGTH